MNDLNTFFNTEGLNAWLPEDSGLFFVVVFFVFFFQYLVCNIILS